MFPANTEMPQSIPRVGHPGKLRERCQIHKQDKLQPATPNELEATTDSATSSLDIKMVLIITTTYIGVDAKLNPARFLHLNRHEVYSQNEGEVIT